VATATTAATAATDATRYHEPQLSRLTASRVRPLMIDAHDPGLRTYRSALPCPLSDRLNPPEAVRALVTEAGVAGLVA
jgi:hypothetical protein